MAGISFSFRLCSVAPSHWLSDPSGTIASHTAGINECWMLSGSFQSNKMHFICGEGF